MMDKVLHRATIRLVKVQWSNHFEQEMTWELEGEMREKFPYLFLISGMQSLED